MPGNNGSNAMQKSPHALVRFALQAALLLRGIGLAQKFLWSKFETESSVFGLLYFDANVSESLALMIDNGLVWIYLLAALASSSTCAKADALRHLRHLGLWFCVAWELLLLAAIVFRKDAIYFWLSPAAHALRIGVPLALLFECRAQNTRWTSRWLRIAIALTFIAHGCQAWFQHPEYATYLLATGHNLFGAQLDQSSVELVLRTIGIVDILIALGVLFGNRFGHKYRWLLTYVVLWGFITAASRVTTGGIVVWHEAVLRASHFCGPLALIGCHHKCLGENIWQPDASPYS